MRLNSKGFTLMELLIVIAIIGLIAAIAAPKMGSTISDAKRSQFVGNFAVLRTAAMLFKAANSGYVLDPDPQGVGKVTYSLDTLTSGLTASLTVAKVYDANKTARDADYKTGIENYLDIREAMLYTEEDGGLGTFVIQVDDGTGTNSDVTNKNKEFFVYCITSDGTKLNRADDVVWHSSLGWGTLSSAILANFVPDSKIAINDMWEKARVE